MRHRLLLASYPAHLRRRHGGELISTLAEMTDGRPTRADRLRLVADGLRERFRLPAGRPWGALALVTATLATLIGGAVGLAAGSLAGARTYPSMPAVAPLATQILGPEVQPERLRREGSELSFTAPLSPAAGGAPAEQRVREIHERLATAGWDVTAVERYRSSDQWSFSARSGGLRVSVVGNAGPTGSVEVLGHPVRPATYLPLVLLGLLAGLVAGWLAGAATAHRLAASPHRVPAAVLAAVGLAVLVAPTARLYQGLVLFLRENDDVGAPVHQALAWMPWPFRDATVFPDSIMPGLRTLLIGLSIAAVAAMVAYHPPGDSPEPVRGAPHRSPTPGGEE
ncbi:hypothetical protein [Actinoplanes sp. M2I2]|uniref:hypothetical protein n=1 Tax=Actinoplanes sp. M2I2 TaxID=1734444 RepID=UPI00201FE9BB|nr:hypothetical protein [Actinoplanes sp. M2I2]